MFKPHIEGGSSPRYGVIDAARGFAAVNMIVYHFLYDLLCYYSLDSGFGAHPAAIIWERCICVTFILIAGAAVNFTRRGYRRGLIVLGGGFLITLLTLLFIPSEIIWFGILNLLGCAMIVTFALRRVLDRIDPLIGAGISLVLFALLYGLPEGYIGFFGVRIAAMPEALYGSPYLAFLGLPSKSFFSADYFPLLPWLFLFFCGYFLWRAAQAKGWDSFFLQKVPVLGLIGRNSLLIYLLHQPVLFALFYLIFGSL